MGKARAKKTWVLPNLSEQDVRERDHVLEMVGLHHRRTRAHCLQVARLVHALELRHKVPRRVFGTWAKHVWGRTGEHLQFYVKLLHIGPDELVKAEAEAEADGWHDLSVWRVASEPRRSIEIWKTYDKKRKKRSADEANPSARPVSNDTETVSNDTETDHSIRTGDARKLVFELENESIHLAATSVPFPLARDFYHEPQQIGHEQTPIKYVKSLTDVFWPLQKKLHPQGTLAVNLADRRATPARRAGCVGWGKQPLPEKPADPQPWGRWMGIPALFVEEMKKAGWIHRDTIILNHTRMSDSRTKRFCNTHDYLLFFVKGMNHKFYPGRVVAPRIHPRSLAHFHRKNGAIAVTQSDTRDIGSVWNVTPPRSATGIAAWGTEVPTRLILAFTEPGDLVLDVFSGTGTTSVAAKATGRRSLGFELHPQTGAQSRERIAIAPQQPEAEQLTAIAKRKKLNAARNGVKRILKTLQTAGEIEQHDLLALWRKLHPLFNGMITTDDDHDAMPVPTFNGVMYLHHDAHHSMGRAPLLGAVRYLHPEHLIPWAERPAPKVFATQTPDFFE